MGADQFRLHLPQEPNLELQAGANQTAGSRQEGLVLTQVAAPVWVLQPLPTS